MAVSSLMRVLKSKANWATDASLRLRSLKVSILAAEYSVTILLCAQSARMIRRFPPVCKEV